MAVSGKDTKHSTGVGGAGGAGVGNGYAGGGTGGANASAASSEPQHAGVGHDRVQPSHPRRPLRSKLLHRIDGIPLVTKLVACMLVLLTIGTFGISFAIRQLVSSYLLDKADTQLRDQAPLIYNSAGWLDGRQSPGNESGIPNDYFMQYRDVHNRIVNTPLVPVLKDGVVSEPTLPANGTMKGVELGQPFTASSRLINVPAGADSVTLERAKAPWRVLALASQDRDDDGNLVVTHVIYIGISLSDQIDVVRTLTQDALYMCIAIILLGAVLGTVLVRHTLAPLKRIEKTAAKIAAGDLSQRIPSAPENTEVGSLAASLNSMLARIELSFREQQETTDKMKQFVSDASHELRTPLAAIQGYAELYTMQRGMPGAIERADDSISHIKSSSSRMTDLVEDLLSLARLDEGRGIDITQNVRLDALFRDSVDDLHALDPERNITQCVLQFTPAHDDSPARLLPVPGAFPSIELNGDASRLRQVFTNVVGNIHRYTTADSPVEVSLSTLAASMSPKGIEHLPPTVGSLWTFLESGLPPDAKFQTGSGMGPSHATNYAIAAIADHGPGVPESKQPQIFERFYTADPSRARLKGGTGLGMSIVQSVIRAHHGFVCASTTPGGGLTLTVILPIGPVDCGDSSDSAESENTLKGSKAQKPTKLPRLSKIVKAPRTAKRISSSKPNGDAAGNSGKAARAGTDSSTA